MLMPTLPGVETLSGRKTFPLWPAALPGNFSLGTDGDDVHARVRRNRLDLQPALEERKMGGEPGRLAGGAVAEPGFDLTGAEGEIRTPDLLITNQLLYH